MRAACGAALVVGFILALGCGGAGPELAAPAAADPFPPDGFLGSWQRSGELLRFTGDTLYNHINGGAEVFLELGFEELLVQSYSSGDDELTVEIYRMTDPAAALGIYLMKCGEETPAPGLEERNTQNSYQLAMLRGRAWVTINRLSDNDSVAEAFVPFAAHVAEELPAGDAGDLFAPLPVKGRVPGSERVVRGPFTLEPVYTFGEGDVLQLGGRVTAVAAEYEGAEGERFTRLVVPYGDANVARSAFEHLVGNLDPYLELQSQTEQAFVFTDYKGHYGVVELVDGILDIRVNLQAAPE